MSSVQISSVALYASLISFCETTVFVSQLVKHLFFSLTCLCQRDTFAVDPLFCAKAQIPITPTLWHKSWKSTTQIVNRVADFCDLCLQQSPWILSRALLLTFPVHCHALNSITVTHTGLSRTSSQPSQHFKMVYVCDLCDLCPPLSPRRRFGDSNGIAVLTDCFHIAFTDCPSKHLSVCLSAHDAASYKWPLLSGCVSVAVSVCLFVCYRHHRRYAAKVAALWAMSPTYQFVCLQLSTCCVHLFFHSFVSLSVHPTVYVSFSLFVCWCLSVRLSVCSSVYRDVCSDLLAWPTAWYWPSVRPWLGWSDARDPKNGKRLRTYL